MTSSQEAAALPPAEFAFPGPLRDALNAAILRGTKTATTSLLREYQQEQEPLPVPGRRQHLIGSHGAPVGVIETTGCRVLPLAQVPWEHACGEGEGYADLADWRRGHEEFWHSAPFREAIGDPGFRVTGQTLVVLESLRCVEAWDKP